MQHGSLFSGIGGFDLAAQWMGWDNVFQCEIEPFAQKILRYHFPEAELFTDITKTDFTEYAGHIDILTGGFPCQPYSVAGKRKGKDDARHLWPEMLRAIREIQPAWVVGENVRGLISWNGGLVFDEVQFDLELEGYEVFPVVLPAAGVNAPHRRERIWFVAYSHSNATRRHGFNKVRRKKSEGESNRYQRERLWDVSDRNATPESFTHSALFGKRSRTKEQTENERSWEQLERSEQRSDANDIYPSADATNASCTGCKEQHVASFTEREGHNTGNAIADWGDFPTQSPVCTGNDGLSTGMDTRTFSRWRNASIKGAGNAIVPQVAYQIFKAIDTYNILY